MLRPGSLRSICPIETALNVRYFRIRAIASRSLKCRNPPGAGVIARNAVEGEAFEVLLPHTLKVTTWGERKAGDKVNIEVGQMARSVA